MTDKADRCGRLIDATQPAAALGSGRTRALGARKIEKCVQEPGQKPVEQRQAFVIDPSERVKSSTGDDESPDPDQFLIWPADQRSRVKLWSPHPTIGSAELAAITKAADRLSRGAKSHSGPYKLDGQPDIRGVLVADVDGDGKADTLYSVALPSVDEPFWQLHYVLGALSTHPGELLALWKTELEDAQTIAAIDLDGDRRDEVLIVEPYYEGGGVSVAKLTGNELKSTGSWWCGE